MYIDPQCVIGEHGGGSREGIGGPATHSNDKESDPTSPESPYLFGVIRKVFRKMSSGNTNQCRIYYIQSCM